MRVRSPDRRNLLEERVALIVGGAGSLGLATARLFLKEGARVVLADREARALKAAESALDDVNVAGVVGDPSREGDVVAATDAVLDRHGRLDVVVVDTGTPAAPGPVTALDAGEFDRFLAVHVRGTFLACKHGLRVLEDGGSVVIVSGVSGLRAEAGASAAAAVEHAQVGLMRSLAKEAAGRGSGSTPCTRGRRSRPPTWPGSRSAGWCGPTRSHARCSTSPRRRAASPPARRWWSTAGSRRSRRTPSLSPLAGSRRASGRGRQSGSLPGRTTPSSFWASSSVVSVASLPPPSPLPVWSSATGPSVVSGDSR
nr:SDR family NAD(P)-dependent oxidoreductase [Blastococcus sp. PRF04-17]